MPVAFHSSIHPLITVFAEEYQHTVNIIIIVIKQAYKYDEWFFIIIITIMDLTVQRNAKIWRALPTITPGLIWKCLLLFITPALMREKSQNIYFKRQNVFYIIKQNMTSPSNHQNLKMSILRDEISYIFAQSTLLHVKDASQPSFWTKNTTDGH